MKTASRELKLQGPLGTPAKSHSSTQVSLALSQRVGGRGATLYDSLVSVSMSPDKIPLKAILISEGDQLFIK